VLLPLALIFVGGAQSLSIEDKKERLLSEQVYIVVVLEFG